MQMNSFFMVLCTLGNEKLNLQIRPVNMYASCSVRTVSKAKVVDLGVAF